jgi:hypothetical protein
MDESVLLLVPLLTLAVVLLFGFTGCALDAEGKLPDDTGRPPGERPPEDGDDGPIGPPRSPTYKDRIMEEGYLVAWWRLSEGGVATTAIDSAGKHPNLEGTYLGNPDLSQSGPLTADTCASFSGAQHVEVAHSMLLNPPDFSIEAWVNPDLQVAAPQPEVLVSSRVRVQGEPYGFALLLDLDPANPRWLARVLGGTAGATEFAAPLGSPDPAQQDGWRHVVVTYRTGTNQFDHDATNEAKVLRLYVDRFPQLDPNNSAHDYIVNVTYTPLEMEQRALRLGAWNDAAPPDQYFYGRLDEVALYNGALTKDRIEKHFDAAV